MHLPFVGRESEIAELRHGLAEASTGRARLYLVNGEAGIGKSRVAEELVACVTGDGAYSVVARCWEAGGAPAYSPWIDVLRAIVERYGQPWLVDALGASVDELGQLLPELAVSPAERGEVDPHAARFRLFESIAAVCRAAANVAPLVILIDDIHVADAASLLLLQHVVRRLPHARLMILATYRDGEVRSEHAFTESLAELLREPATRRMPIAGLDDDAIQQLVAQAGAQRRPGLVAQLRDKTEGNPLYLGEVLRMLITPGATTSEQLQIPADVREIILRRLGTTSSTTREVLDIACTLGREFDLEVLGRLTGDLDLVPALEEAAALAVVNDVPDRPGRMRFSHAVIREALYGDLSPPRKRRLHARAADTIEQLQTADADAHLTELAHHLSAAVPEVSSARAAAAASTAGRRAAAGLAFEDGVRLLTLAVRLLGPNATRGERCSLLLALGDAQARAGDGDGSRATFLRAAALAREGGDGRSLAEAALGYGGRFVWMRAGLDVRLVPLLTEALDATDPGDSILRARLLGRLAGARRDEPDVAGRAALGQQAADSARRLGDPTTLAWALTARFTSRFGPDAMDEMIALAGEIGELAELSGEEERIGDACWVRFLLSTVIGEIRTARDQVPVYARLADELRQPSQRWYAGVMRSIVLIVDGRLAEAEQVAEETLQLGEHAQAWDAGASHRLGLSMIRWEQGRLAEMKPLLLQSLDEYPGYRLFGCLLALIDAQAGRRDDALAQLDALSVGGAGALPRDGGYLFGMTMLAEVVTLLGDQARASTLYELLLPHRRLVGTASGEVISGSVERPLGRLALLLGRPADAANHLTAALERHRSMETPQWIAHSEHDLSALLLHRNGPGDVEAGSRLLDSCLSRAQALGLDAVAAQARALEKSTAEQRSHRASRTHELTPREMEVVCLVAQGRSNREIAAALVVSGRTVESHVQNVLSKLGFTSRTQVATWAVANELAGPPRQ